MLAVQPNHKVSGQLNVLKLVFQLFSWINYLNGSLVIYRLDFEYLKDLPILVLDVNEDFKNDRIKQEGVIDKVRIWVCGQMPSLRVLPVMPVSHWMRKQSGGSVCSLQLNRGLCFCYRRVSSILSCFSDFLLMCFDL